MNATQPTDLERVITGLARDRGFAGLQDLAVAVNEATGLDYTAAELVDWPRRGFGRHLDAVLALDEKERRKLVDAVVERVNASD